MNHYDFFICTGIDSHVAIPHFTLIYVRRFSLLLVGAKCISDHVHMSFKEQVLVNNSCVGRFII